MIAWSQQQTDAASRIGDAMMGQLSEAALHEQEAVERTGQFKTLTALGEGVAKTIKAIGDTVKALC